MATSDAFSRLVLNMIKCDDDDSPIDTQNEARSPE